MSHSTTYRSIAFATVLVAGLSFPAFGSESNNTAPSITGTYAFRMTPAKSFTADAPGDPGGIANAPRQDILRVGTFTGDGNGNLSGHTLATTDTNQGHTWLVIFDWTGKYGMNGDGTGFFSVDKITNMVCTDMTVAHTGATPHPATSGGTPLLGNATAACTAANPAIEGHEDYAFVFSTPSGKKLDFIETDNDGGGAKIFMTGSATRQNQAGSNNDNGGDDNGSNGNGGNGNGDH